MSEPPRLRGHRRAALSVLALAVAVTTCRDAPSGPSGQRGFVNISPVFTAGMNPAAFGITIDSLRAVVVRPPTDTLVDRTVAFPADSSALELGLSVLLQAPVETLTVHLQYLGAGLLLFTGSADVEVTTGVPGDEPPVEIPVGEYVGPGRDADSIVVTPADSIVSWGDSLRFRVAAFQAGVPLTQFFVSWTSTDPINAPVNGAGVLRAPGRRDTVFVIARTPPTSVRPGGVVDSVAVTFMPLPAAIAIVSGNGQSGSTGAPLAEALRVRVTATDGGGVAFARVRFRVALGGGSVADTLVIADDRGFAQTLATLGLTVGAQVFEASLDASRFVTFNASAIAGQAVRLEFTQQPGATTAGIALTPAVQVTARDTAGAIAAGFTGPVTVALLANPGGATLGGTATVNAVAGVASFGDLVLDRTSTGYTLLATAPSLAADTSAAFSVVAAAATQLVFTTQPASAIAGTAIPVVVTARDAFGNTATGFTGNVAIAIAANPGTGTLSGTATVAAVSGIATFATLSIDKVGTGYTLSATAGALPAATSAAFNISPAAASQLAFTTQPVTTVAGVAIPMAVTVRDAFGNTATGFAGSVTVAIGTNPGTGILSGTASQAVVAGVATFANLSIDKVGIGYTLTATSGALTAATSAAFNITPAAASQLVFTTPPVTSVAGVAIPVTVTARDAFGNTATGFTGTVALAIGTNPGTGSLSGTASVAAAAGVATFSTLSIDKVGAGYTLVATAASLVPDTSAAFTITPAAASQLVFTAEPTTAVAGVAIAPDVIVEALDPFGNLATGFTGSVAVAIGTNPGGGTLAGTDTVAAVSGVATFSTLAIDKVGAGYTLVATAASLAPDTSAVFNISPAAASQLAFTTPPVTTVAGVAIPVVVTARDAFGNTATGFSGGVTLALGANPGGSTFGNPTVSAVAGVATFSAVSLDKVGTGYTLVATSGALTQATSAAFNITPAAASQLAFTTQPVTTVAGVAVPVVVTARDAFGNTATGFTGGVTLTLGANPGGSTFGNPTVSAVAGVATFSAVSLDKVGTGYTLVATSGTLTQATSAAFNITPAAASQLAFTTQPVTTVAGVAVPVTVTARDAFGNTATGFTGNVAVAIGTNPTGATLAGTTSQTAVAGVATFANLSIDTVGTGYTLVATSGALTQATSAAFNITPAAATQLVFTTQPVTTVAGVAIPVVVTARDALGNTATGFTGDVAIAIGTNPTGATLAGTTSQAAVAGVATFANLSIDTVGTGYTLTAASGALTGATSTTFDITPGPASQLVFTAQPTDIAEGDTITPAVQVEARDAQGNRATAFADSVFIAIADNPSSDGILSGTLLVEPVAGVATFDDLSIDLAGVGYTLRVLVPSVPAVAGDTSAPFTVTANLPDLVPTRVVGPATGVTGGTASVSVTAYNLGAGAASAGWSGEIRLSADSVCLSSAIDPNALAYTETVALASGDSTTATRTATIPIGIAPGTYNWCVILDPAGGTVTESDESNNTAIGNQITISAQTVHSADIVVSETWAAAQSPHIVTRYLRVINGATLTIEDGAEVRFDADAGLQVGDTNEATLGQTGGLVMQGTPGSITLTANTATPAPGFWRGIEVQNSLAVPAWTNVLIEWAGGARPVQTPTTEACVLIVNDKGQPLVMDSVTIRRCVHAAIHLFGGDLDLHRSRIDSVTGSGIHVDFQARLLMDSTRITGSGGEGLLVASPVAGLSTTEFNKFIGNALASVRLHAPQLRGFKQQDSIAGNGFLGGFGDSIVVDGGLVNGGGAQLSLFAQDAPYLVLGHLKMVNASVILKPGLVMAFDQTAGFQFGDSTVGNDAQVTSEGTAANRVMLTSRTTLGWRGVYLGRQSGPTTLGHVHITNGGYMPGPTQTAANLLVEAGGGSGPVNVDGMTSIDSRNHGIVILSAPASGFTVRDDTIQGSAGMGLAVAAPATLADEIVRNVITPNNGYPLGVEVHALPGLGANIFGPNTRDTLLLLGGTLTVPATLPHVAGVPWRVVTNIDIDGGALDVAADTLFFDDSTEVRVGGQQPGGLRAVGATPWRKLFTATPGHPAWWGIEYTNVLVGGASPLTTLRNVVVEKAGHYEPCFGDCGPTPFGALRYYNQSAEGVVFDSIVVRLSRSIALDVQPPGSGGLTVLRSQFYLNPFEPMIQGPLTPGNGQLLTISNSDIYKYGGVPVSGIYQGTGADSVVAIDNWWGDVDGASPQFSFQDSLGRAAFGGYAVRFVPFARAPHFPVGPAALMGPTTDTSLIVFPRHVVGDTIGNPDSIRVRVLDAMGRGVGGTNVGWSVPVGSGTVSSPTGTTIVGGRSPGVVFYSGMQSGPVTVEAANGGLIGSPVRFTDSLTAAATVSSNWQIVQAGPGGTISSALDSVSYTSSNMTTVLVTNARDQFDNVTVPTSYYFFTDVPNSGFKSYGTVDSTRGDTVFFRPQVVSPGTYQLRGLYDGGLVQDSVIISVATSVAGIAIDRDVNLPFVQDTGRHVFNALCPVGGPCGFHSERSFTAHTVDPGGAEIVNPGAVYQWSIDPAGTASVTIDSVRGPAGAMVFISAHTAGSTRLFVEDFGTGSQTLGDRDTMLVLADQIGSFIVFTPPEDTLLVGQETTFQAQVHDLEGAPLVNEVVHFMVEPFAPGRLTITDTSVVNQVKVRLDSTPHGYAYVRAFWPRPLKDTLYGYIPGDTVPGYGYVVNPAQTPIDVGGSPYAAAVNPLTNRIYVTNAGGTGITVIDGADNSQATVDVGGPTSAAVVNPKTNRAYVAMFTTLGNRLWTLDGGTGAVVDSGGGNFHTGGMAVDTARNRVYVAASLCVVVFNQVTFSCNNTGESQVAVLNGSNLSQVIDTLPRTIGGAGGIAFNPVTGRIYVAVQNGPVDTVRVIDAATLQVIGSIPVGSGAAGVAVNPVTNRIYVTNSNDGTVSVIAGASNTVIQTVFVGSSSPWGIGVDPVRNLVYVSSSSDFGVAVLDGATNLVIGYIYVDGNNTDAQPNPVTGRVYVPVYGSGQVRVLQYQ